MANKYLDLTGLSYLWGKIKAKITADISTHNSNTSAHSDIRTALNGKAAASHNHNASDINAGILALARGGTGADTALEAKKNLELFPGKLFPTETADPTNTVYVSPSGSDDADGTQDAPMKTIRAAINKYGGSNYLRLYLADGTYTDAALLTLSAVSFISIISVSGNAENVILKFPLYFRGVSFYMENVTIDVSTFDTNIAAYAVTGRSCSFGLSGCVIVGRASETQGIVARYGAAGFASVCTVSSCSKAIRADTGGTIFTTTLTSAAANGVGYSAIGGLIALTGNGLTANTQYEKSGAGIIYASGNQVT